MLRLSVILLVLFLDINFYAYEDVLIYCFHVNIDFVSEDCKAFIPHAFVRHEAPFYIFSDFHEMWGLKLKK